MRYRTIGILGSMGPESTVRLFENIVKATTVTKEQDHPRIIIDNNPQIPDRTEAILGYGKSPIEELQMTAKNLEKAGAQIIAIPCNTAHFYIKHIIKSVDIEIINMIQETAIYIEQNIPQINRVGLLSTKGTIKSKIYHTIIKELEILTPEKDDLEKLMNYIYGKEGIKLGKVQENKIKVKSLADLLIEQGAEAIIAGCTELSLVLSEEDLSVPLIDPLNILALSTIKKAKE